MNRQVDVTQVRLKRADATSAVGGGILGGTSAASHMEVADNLITQILDGNAAASYELLSENLRVSIGGLSAWSQDLTDLFGDDGTSEEFELRSLDRDDTGGTTFLYVVYSEDGESRRHIEVTVAIIDDTLKVASYNSNIDSSNE
jgi:hypothetical protein